MALIDSFEELMASFGHSRYRDCLKAADVLSSKLSAEIERIERTEATDAKLATMLKAVRNHMRVRGREDGK